MIAALKPMEPERLARLRQIAERGMKMHIPQAGDMISLLDEIRRLRTERDSEGLMIGICAGMDFVAWII